MTSTKKPFLILAKTNGVSDYELTTIPLTWVIHQENRKGAKIKCLFVGLPGSSFSVTHRIRYRIID